MNHTTTSPILNSTETIEGVWRELEIEYPNICGGVNFELMFSFDDFVALNHNRGYLGYKEYFLYNATLLMIFLAETGEL